MTLQAGSACVEITPEQSVPMSGYGARDESSSGVHDPLTATALVLTDGSTTVALVSVDLLNVSRALTTGVERRLSAETNGVQVDELVLAATHTHGGPYVPTQTIDIHPTLAVDEDLSWLLEDLECKISSVVVDAYERREPASVRVGTATDDGTMVNRREAMGTRVPVSPDVVDREVSVMLVEGESGAETVLFTLACHPVSITASDTELTADWPGVVRREIQAARGSDTTVLFLNGAAGDVTTRDHSVDADSKRGDDHHAYATEMGQELAETVLEAVDDASATPASARGPILTDRRTLRLPVKSTPDLETLEARERSLLETRDRLREDGHDEAAMRYDRDVSYVRELRAISAWGSRHVPARLQYVEVGSMGLLSFPGEALVQHGLEFKAAAAVDNLFVTGYATDYVGYLPTLRELENWGYEVRTAKVAPEAIVAFSEAGIDLVSR